MRRTRDREEIEATLRETERRGGYKVVGEVHWTVWPATTALGQSTGGYDVGASYDVESLPPGEREDPK